MKYKTALAFTVLFLCLTNWVFAQKENNNWYFGGIGGITFNSGSPIPLATNAMIAAEGTISVSDPAGNLLFYSDGSMIWNRNHIPMQNGIGMLGGFSATQAILAVSKPGSSAIYYIFTVDDQINNLQNGLRYSILDMSLDGGLGGITNTKNVLIESPVTEKLIAVRHGNNKDYWILVHKWNSDEFLAYELTSAGLTTTPVSSKIGSFHGGSLFNVIGQMKASREGTKLALAIYGLNRFELFDFNTSTGAVSNWQTTNAPIIEPYGVEFSGDGSKLYVTANAFNNQASNTLLQFDLADSTGLNTVYPLFTGPNRFYSLQLGPDKKIYCNPNSSYLGVINYPDSIGSSCNFNRNGLNLISNVSSFGFPNMILTACQPNASGLIKDTTLCIGDSLILSQETIAGNAYLWQDGSTKSTYVVTKPGIYILRVKNWYFEEAFEFNVQFKDCSPVISNIPIIPNIITPNQDKLNDAFVLKNLNATDFELQIFNRWGSLVYKTESYQNDWDARENSAGMYYYLLRNSETGSTYKGWLEVIK